MASADRGRADWKDPTLAKLFIELCLKEFSAKSRVGNSFGNDSWEKIRLAFKEQKKIDLIQKQLKNQWEYLRKKYNVWAKIINKIGNCYDSASNTINWSSEDWDAYIAVNEDAKQFRYAPIKYPNEMKALFDGLGATGKYAWGPSKEGLPADSVGACSQMHINLDDVNIVSPSSPNEEIKLKVKRRKKDKSHDIDEQLTAVLKTLEQSDGPDIKECNRILDEMHTLPPNDLLYIVACSIFCESKAYRERAMGYVESKIRRSHKRMNSVERQEVRIFINIKIS